MSSLRFCAMIAAVGLVGPGLGQPPDPKKNPAKPNNEVEVKFGDTVTNVRMIILQEKIDIMTRFGKLEVPLTEVRKIDFGVHLEEGVLDKVQAAIKKLNSEVFKERDEAVKDLVKIGPPAFPALSAAAKTSDQEISTRAQMALKQIKGKYNADQLRLTVNDRIVTNDFPIVGRIVSPTIRAQNAYFGARDLKLTELRSIIWLGNNTDVEVLVDAGKYCHRTNWMDTGVPVEAGSGLQINASGEVDLLPGNGGGEFISGPQGNLNVGGRFGGIGGNRLPGTLLGKVGESGTAFVVGERYYGMPGQEGKLYLQIVPGNFGGNQQAQGNYKVKISSGLR